VKYTIRGLFLVILSCFCLTGCPEEKIPPHIKPVVVTHDKKEVSITPDAGVPFTVQSIENDLNSQLYTVVSIDFSNIRFDDFKDLRVLLGNESNSVQRLNLTDNFQLKDTNYNVKSFSDFIPVISDPQNKITTLNLSNNNLNSAAFTLLLVYCVKNKTHLKTLDVSNNSIGDRGLSLMISALKNGCPLSKVDLSQNTFSVEARKSATEQLNQLRDTGRDIKIIL
jgi:Ran GTPase-activating protein (RanGAP) involved in mRNA processing and transport